MKPVPVLMYHHVNNHEGDMVTVTPETFELQMQYLNKAGYRTLNTDELLSYIKGDLQLKEKAVMITFDDGWLDNYIYAYPLLKKYDIKATIFIVGNWIEEASKTRWSSNKSVPTHEESVSLIGNKQGAAIVLNWELIREMRESGLVEFYSHAKNHVKCHLLSKDDLSDELRESKNIIETQLGGECIALCWPFGRYNDGAIKTAKATGYRALFTTDHGVATERSDPFAIQRIAVKDSLIWFKKSLIIYTNKLLSGVYLRLKKK